MNSSRDEASLVGLTLRLRESLRRDLEETAKERGVSLNQQITDCLEHFRDRRSLLPEVLATAFTDQTAGIALMVARVMEVAAQLHLHRRGLGRHYLEEDNHWLKHPAARAEAFNAAIAVLSAFPLPDGNRKRQGGADSIEVARDLVRAIGRRPGNPLSSRIVNDIRDLLGPLAKQLTHPRPSPRSRPPLAPAQAAESASTKIADAVVELINSSPRTPSREELAQTILSHLSKGSG